jgi:VWFA-related protein
MLRPHTIIGLAALALLAQDVPTLRVDVNLVNLFFSVRDKNGALVSNLTQEDFQVFEDGKPQTIRYFSRQTDLPLTLGLLVDVSRSQQNLIEIERRAATQFFAQVLRSKDLAFLISFGSEVELLQDLTSSPKLLSRALEGLRVNSAPVGIHPGPVPTASKPKGTLLYDAIYLAATEKLKNETGRKALILITDGVDQGSHYSREEAINAAHRADAIIYSIEYYDPGAYAFLGGGGGGATLKRLAQETGGRAFKVDRKNTLEAIFKQIDEELRSQYSLAYSPTNAARDGSFRHIEVRTRHKDYKVQVRRGYFAPTN